MRILVLGGAGYKAFLWKKLAIIIAWMSPFNDNRHTTLKGECVYDYKQFQQRASGYFRCIT